jgi:non-heme Fe2+,alpha-ketoglutarate-dependent halogenase
VEDLIGPDILLMGSPLFAKQARDPRFVSWHQDSAYFGLNPHAEVTAWVAFTDSNETNGCVRVMPRSHRAGDFQHEERAEADNMLARGQTITGLDEAKAVDLVLKAGEFFLHQERTVHGSHANRSDDRRIGLAYFYFPAHVRSQGPRRSALLVRGVDRHGHWDADPLPRCDLDALCMAELDRVWGQYRKAQYTAH